MPAHFPGAFTNTLNIGASGTSAETIAASCGPFQIGLDNQQVLIFWMIALTIGTAGVTCQIRIRRGLLTLTGSVINNNVLNTVVAGNVYTFSGVYADFPVVAGNLGYSLTTQIGSATANSTYGDVSLDAFAI